MTNITAHDKRRYAIMKTSIIAMFGSILFMVGIPFLISQPGGEPIAKFKPYRAQELSQASVVPFVGE